MEKVMKALFVVLLLLVLGGLYLAFPAGLTSVRFLVVVALGVLGVLAWIIYGRVRQVIAYINGRAIDDQGHVSRGIDYWITKSTFHTGTTPGLGVPDTNKPTEPPPNGF